MPGYGKKVLDFGYTMYEKTGDLTAVQYLELFKSISESEEYPTSNLKTAFTLSPDARYSHHDEIEDLYEDKELTGIPV